MKTRRCNNGVSLIEMLIAVAVIALLATMAIGIASRIESQTKEKAVKGLFASLEGALQEYREFTGDFPIQPSTAVVLFEGIAAGHSRHLCDELRSIPRSREILEKIDHSLMKSRFQDFPPGPIPGIYDPWGMPLDYVYGPDDTFPKLTSAGPDKRFGTADDISNR